MESIGTRACIAKVVKALLDSFSACTVRALITIYDLSNWPAWIGSLFPDRMGWFIAFDATK